MNEHIVTAVLILSLLLSVISLLLERDSLAKRLSVIDFQMHEHERLGERPVVMSVELMDLLCTRDHAGNRLRIEWGEPDSAGFYTPTIHVDYEDNPLRKGLERAEASTARIVYAFNDCIALRNWDKGWEGWADVEELKAALAGEEKP
jgi:hypothetical protein